MKFKRGPSIHLDILRFRTALPENEVSENDSLSYVGTEGAKRLGPVTMVHPDQDAERMTKWRRELGPEKHPYRDDE